MPALPDPRHEKIVQAYAKGNLAQTDAYKLGGYKASPQSACTFFARPEVKQRLKEVRELRTRLAAERDVETSAEAAKKLGITKTKILEALWVNARLCLRGAPIYDEKGQPTGKFRETPSNPSAGNQALKLLGMEAFGMFVERLEVGGPGDFARLSDEELAARVEADAAALGLPADATEALMLTFQPGEKASDDGSNA